MKFFITLILLLAVSNYIAVYGQNTASDSEEPVQLISASQGIPSPLIFEVQSATRRLHVSSFDDKREFNIRGGLPNFFSKSSRKKPVVIGFIGGSITQGKSGYRLQTARMLKSMFPLTPMQGINAGVSGTGTDLGACRIKDQVLAYNPDLIFIEFAVNGAYAKGMEGMVRQIREKNPQTDICFIYTIHSGQSKEYAAGNIPANIRGLDSIADHYIIPSVHLGLEASILEKQGKLIWKGDTTNSRNKIVFSTDGIHPLEAGGNLYAAAIARAMAAMKNTKASGPYKIPPALHKDNWEDAQMLDPSTVATFSAGWRKLATSQSAHLNKFQEWFRFVMTAEDPGESFSFRFNGNMFGIFDIGGPEVGQLSIEVDGVPFKFSENTTESARIRKAGVNKDYKHDVLNRFNAYCNNRYRGQYDFIELSPGIHKVTIKIDAQKSDKHKILGPEKQDDIQRNPAKYDRSVLYLGKILLRGKLVHG
jgi:lysophospholipase L1-like esterase